MNPWQDRHPSVAHFASLFGYAHLPERLQRITDSSGPSGSSPSICTARSANGAPCACGSCSKRRTAPSVRRCWPMPEPHVVTCPDCSSRLGAAPGTRLKHNADGTHTVIPPTPPRAITDPKPRGRRRA